MRRLQTAGVAGLRGSTVTETDTTYYLYRLPVTTLSRRAREAHGTQTARHGTQRNEVDPERAITTSGAGTPFPLNSHLSQPLRRQSRRNAGFHLDRAGSPTVCPDGYVTPRASHLRPKAPHGCAADNDPHEDPHQELPPRLARRGRPARQGCFEMAAEEDAKSPRKAREGEDKEGSKYRDRHRRVGIV